jgi:hypothetical protein
MRKKRPIHRSENRTRDASRVVIASEDRYAVKQYFDIFQSTRVQFHVLETDQGRSSPEHVMARLDEYLAEYSVGEGDQFWLVCDTDHWIQSIIFRTWWRLSSDAGKRAFLLRCRTHVSIYGCCFISTTFPLQDSCPVVKLAI